MYVTLEQVKKHLNIEPTYVDDDLYLLDLVSVSEKLVEGHLNKELRFFEDSNHTLEAPLVQAILVMTANLYNNRESVAPTQMHEVPKTYEYLLQFYKNYTIL